MTNSLRMGNARRVRSLPNLSYVTPTAATSKTALFAENDATAVTKAAAVRYFGVSFRSTA